MACPIAYGGHNKMLMHLETQSI